MWPPKGGQVRLLGWYANGVRLPNLLSALEGVAIGLGPGQPSPYIDKLPAGWVRASGWSPPAARAACAGCWRFRIWPTRLHTQHVPEPHGYLNLVVVDPPHLGTGFASRLIKPFLHLADQQSLRCYLEAQNPRNIPLYIGMGFVVAEQRPLPGSAVVNYAMVRPVT